VDRLRGQQLSVHGWIYGLKDGRIRDLKTTVSNTDEAPEAYRRAIEAL
jgi:carbonic anhydrase